ncbi:hypothetical protein J3U66_12510 [Gilliamella sp. B2969]|uniref:hypothetical protein n=1 Tax=Gilliamella sp. B2969 TaxID=2818021 RepID=UPI00226A18B5|nr:hypothetical protein [Gilliamella sp. B2969]MCX8731202.1 hypothetical protein [Gilliamella sp. B2969]
MSTIFFNQDFVNSLDIEQLLCLKKLTNDRIDQLREESKTNLIRVSTECLNLGFFRETEKEQAFQLLINEINKDSLDDYIDFLYEIKIVSVDNSDVESLLEL